MSGDDTPRGRDLTIARRLANGDTRRHVAQAEGVSQATISRTARRWRTWIDTEREATAEQAATALAAAVPRAVSTLLRLLDSDSPMAQLGAARAVLGAALSWRDSVTLERRLSDLEAASEGYPWERGA